MYSQQSFRQFIRGELESCEWHQRQFGCQESARFQPYESLQAKEESQAVYEDAIMCASIWIDVGVMLLPGAMKE